MAVPRVRKALFKALGIGLAEREGHRVWGWIWQWG